MGLYLHSSIFFYNIYMNNCPLCFKYVEYGDLLGPLDWSLPVSDIPLHVCFYWSVNQ